MGNGSQIITVVVVSSLFYGATERSTQVLGAVVLVIAGGTRIG